ncbi:hypothetical protein [Chitinilyticum piscinae]|uniref:Uncharacterized protein n=1 Tax=Chitinilyticum piscinae TaxID=2866724 RepID=A0A8J7KH29_9NEIS|nr:hypothetical protein [Chitinilyticum piscinae]MBE9611034.1 hypothetical protein [Chitinilyticum piscinae]
MSKHLPTGQEQAAADLRFDQFMQELDTLAKFSRSSFNYRQVADAVLFGARMRVLYALGKPRVYLTSIDDLGSPPRAGKQR